MKTKLSIVVLLVLALTASLVGVVSAQGPQPPVPPERVAAEPGIPTSPRLGAWLDEVVFTVEDSETDAIARLQAGDLDLYASSIGSKWLFQAVLEAPNLDYTESYGSYELTFNPYGPTFNDGRLNPFSSARIREAVNRLVDRTYIAQVIGGGLGKPRWVPVYGASSDYTRYQSAIRALETQYAYDLTRAQTDIADEMQSLGASLQNGTWHYNGQQIVLIFLIRVEDVRRPIGDYVADQLEEVGFTVDRRYMTRSEAFPIWWKSAPADGQWHLYTGGWITPQISRNEGDTFSFFYTPAGPSCPLWQAYRPTAEFSQVALRLRDNDFQTMTERDTLFEQALPMALNDRGSAVPEGVGSVRVWLADWTPFIPRRSELAVVSDRAGGIQGAQMWPYAIRFVGQEGGTARIAQPGLLVDPWNPVAGSNWVYDAMPIRATQDYAFIADPNDGLVWPQRAERADVVVQAGLPVTKTHDWVHLSFTPQITVPADAWVDWDATNQRFITRAEKYPDGLTATVKISVTYPAGMFSSVTWHDGSPLDLSDLVMTMILTFDRGKPESAIYDESAVGDLDAFLSHFRGVRIVSEEPLVIETYDNVWQLDAERIAQAWSWWPNYGYGPGAWHNLAVAIRAEAAGELAFSAQKAGDLYVPWTDFIAGDSLAILGNHLSQAASQSYIPYSPTLGAYITQGEANTRWNALQNWSNTYGHFWIGTGPFYLAQAFPDEPRLVLEHYPGFPDPAGRWDAFVAEPNPQLQINYSSGAPGSYFNVTGSGFTPNGTAFIVVNGHLLDRLPVDSNGTISFTLATTEATQGFYHLRVSVNPAAGIQFRLSPNEPVRPREGELPVIEVPAGLTGVTYLPLVLRNH